jgi:hypothetical protein
VKLSDNSKAWFITIFKTLCIIITIGCLSLLLDSPQEPLVESVDEPLLLSILRWIAFFIAFYLFLKTMVAIKRSELNTVNYPPTPLRVDQWVFSTDYINDLAPRIFDLAQIFYVKRMPTLYAAIGGFAWNKDSSNNSYLNNTRCSL